MRTSDSLQLKPKRLLFALDCSSSMARGNGWDGRLDRTAATAVLLMESLEKVVPGSCTYAPNITQLLLCIVSV